MLPRKDELEKAVADIRSLVENLAEPFRTAATVVLLGERLRQVDVPLRRELGVPVEEKQLSVSELLKRVGPTSYTETALAVGYHFENVRKKKSFSIADLNRGFQDAKEPLPTNMNDVVNRCVANGWMMDAEYKESKAAWTLTRTGEEIIITRMKGEAK